MESASQSVSTAPVMWNQFLSACFLRQCARNLRLLRDCEEVVHAIIRCCSSSDLLSWWINFHCLNLFFLLLQQTMRWAKSISPSWNDYLLEWQWWWGLISVKFELAMWRVPDFFLPLLVGTWGTDRDLSCRFLRDIHQASARPPLYPLKPLCNIPITLAF